MKKQLIAVVSALAMTFTSLPCVSIAAENVPKPVLQYTFDGNKQLADQNGKDRKSTRLNSSHNNQSRMPSSA